MCVIFKGWFFNRNGVMFLCLFVLINVFILENYLNLVDGSVFMKGRPLGSQVRQNIIEILYFMGHGCGYDIYKIYVAIFPKVTMRLIYYHLNKGYQIWEFKIYKVGKEKWIIRQLFRHLNIQTTEEYTKVST